MKYTTSVTDKDAFWEFAKNHWLNYKDYTDLIGIVLHWMGENNFEQRGVKEAEYLYHKYLKQA